MPTLQQIRFTNKEKAAFINFMEIPMTNIKLIESYESNDESHIYILLVESKDSNFEEEEGIYKHEIYKIEKKLNVYDELGYHVELRIIDNGSKFRNVYKDIGSFYIR
jgi:hypothetical protein